MVKLRVRANIKALLNPRRMEEARRTIRIGREHRVRWHERELCCSIAREFETSALSGNGSGVLVGPRHHEATAAHWIATEIARRARFDAPRLTVDQEREECARVADKIAQDARNGKFVLNSEQENMRLVEMMRWVANEIRARGGRK